MHVEDLDHDDTDASDAAADDDSDDADADADAAAVADEVGGDDSAEGGAMLERDDGVDDEVAGVHVEDLDDDDADAVDAAADDDSDDDSDGDDGDSGVDADADSADARVENDAEADDEADDPATAIAADETVTDDEAVTEDEADELTDARTDGEADAYELPEIVPATPDDPEADADTDARARPGTDPDDDVEVDEVSEEILEELRRADIDGPVVDFAPQDDTASARRKPRRSADYDPAPVPIPAKIPRVLGRKPRVRKVTRVVRHVDPWSVFKIALVAHAVVYVIVLTAGVLLWNVAHATGTVDNVERFFESFGWQSFEFDGGEIYHAAWIAGLFAVIGLTGLAVLTATLFNLITDLVGGMRFTVLEEEVVETRVSPMRRFVVRRAEPEVPAVLHDESGAMVREAVVDDTGANPRPSR